MALLSPSNSKLIATFRSLGFFRQMQSSFFRKDTQTKPWFIVICLKKPKEQNVAISFEFKGERRAMYIIYRSFSCMPGVWVTPVAKEGQMKVLLVTENQLSCSCTKQEMCCYEQKR